MKFESPEENGDSQFSISTDGDEAGDSQFSISTQQARDIIVRDVIDGIITTIEEFTIQDAFDLTCLSDELMETEPSVITID